MIQVSRTSFILPIYLIKMKLLYSFYLDGNASTQPFGAPPYLYVICHSRTKRVKRFVNCIKGGFRVSFICLFRRMIWKRQYYFSWVAWDKALWCLCQAWDENKLAQICLDYLFSFSFMHIFMKFYSLKVMDSLWFLIRM